MSNTRLQKREVSHTYSVEHSFSELRPIIRHDMRQEINNLLKEMMLNAPMNDNTSKLHRSLLQVFLLDPVLLLDLCKGFSSNSESRFVYQCHLLSLEVKN